MAKGRRTRRRGPDPDADAPRPVTPPPPPAVPRNARELDDKTLAPGDPFVKAAYQRVNQTTRQLGGSLGAAVNDAQGTDALMIRKMSRRSRVMSFQIQGIVWKAGFAKELPQTPLGAALRLGELPAAETHLDGAVLRPVEASLDTVFRELIPPALMEDADRMYGLTRLAVRACMYLVPREDGALAGLIVGYGDSPTSRRHYMYLQTGVRRADPAILEQMLKTFQNALPRAEEAAKEKSSGDFWSELERNLYQVRATYRASALHESQQKVKASLTSQLANASQRVDKAMVVAEKGAAGLEWLLNLPVRAAIVAMNGLTGSLVWVIRGVDGLFRRKPRS